MTESLVPRLAADAVVLRAWRPQDVDQVFQACQDEQIQRWTTVPVPYLREHAEQFILEAPQRWESGSATFAAAHPTSDQVIGSFGFVTAPSDGVVEIGYWVASDARGQGVATAATRLLCGWGFDSLELARIEWRAEVGNVASRMVAEACGFTVEGRLRHGLGGRSGNVDGWLGSLLRDEPRQRKAARLLPAEPVAVTGGRPSVTLRAPAPADDAWVLAAYRDDDIARWNPSNVTDLATAREWIAQRSDWTDQDHASWLVTDTTTGVVRGSVSIHKINRENLTASIGYWTHPDHRGLGYSTRAVQVAADWALRSLGLKRIELIHAVDNPASCRVAERAGFELEGTLRQGERYGDDCWHDEHVHGRVAS